MVVAENEGSGKKIKQITFEELLVQNSYILYQRGQKYSVSSAAT